jgi:hypothetical protein
MCISDLNLYTGGTMEILPIETYPPPPMGRSVPEDRPSTEETENIEESETQQQTEETPPPEEGGKAENIDTFA